MAGKNRNTFEKMQREMQKKRKADEKRERRRERKEAVAAGPASNDNQETGEPTRTPLDD